MVFHLAINPFQVLCFMSPLPIYTNCFPDFCSICYSFDFKERQLKFWGIWFWLRTLIMNGLSVCSSTNKLLKTLPGKRWVFYLHICNILKMKQTSAEKNGTLFNTPKENYMQSVFNKVHFWPKIPHTLFPPSFLHVDWELHTFLLEPFVLFVQVIQFGEMLVGTGINWWLTVCPLEEVHSRMADLIRLHRNAG